MNTQNPKGKAYAQWLAKCAARRKRIESMMQSGISQSEIARLLKISRQRLHQIVNGQ